MGTSILYLVGKLLPILLTLLSSYYLSAASEYFRLLENSTMTTYAATNNIPLHIEEDLFIPGNLLFSTSYTLTTMDSSRLATILVGSTQRGYAEGVGEAAKFDFILGFIQLNASHVLVVDFRNHCVRSVNRLTNQTSHYIGSCESSGDEDGADPKFNYPWGIIRDIMDSNQSLIITDYSNKAIKRITQTPRAAETIIQSNELNRPRGLTQQPISGDIYVVTGNSIVRYDYSLGTLVSLPATSTVNYPNAAIFLANNNLLVSDTGNHQLKLIDLDNNTTMTICNGEEATADGNLTECEIRSPQGLAVVGDKLYIGSYGGIRVIQGTTAPTTIATSTRFTPTTTTITTLTTTPTPSTSTTNKNTGTTAPTTIATSTRFTPITTTTTLTTITTTTPRTTPLTTSTTSLTTGSFTPTRTPSTSTTNKNTAYSITDVQLAMIIGGIVAVLLIAALSAVCIYRIRYNSRNTNEQEVQIEVQDYLPPVNRQQPGIPLELDHVYSDPDENGIYVLNPTNYDDDKLERPAHHAPQMIENVAVYDEVHDDGYEQAICPSAEGRIYTTLGS